MSKKVFRIFTAGLLLLALLICFFFVGGPQQVHAAEAGKYYAHQAQSGGAACASITTSYYAWGIEWHVPQCAAEQFASGVNLIPKAGPIASTLINDAIKQSCDGSVYVDMVYVAAFASVVRPAC